MRQSYHHSKRPSTPIDSKRIMWTIRRMPVHRYRNHSKAHRSKSIWCRLISRSQCPNIRINSKIQIFGECQRWEERVNIIWVWTESWNITQSIGELSSISQFRSFNFANRNKLNFFFSYQFELFRFSKNSPHHKAPRNQCDFFRNATKSWTAGLSVVATRSHSYE